MGAVPPRNAVLRVMLPNLLPSNYTVATELRRVCCSGQRAPLTLCVLAVRRCYTESC